MNEESQSNQLTRRGFPVYLSNPSISDVLPSKISPKKKTKPVDAYMVSPGTGEIITRGAFSFVEEEEVDTEQFVKVYHQGIKKHSEMSKAGMALFDFVYDSMRGQKGKDKDMVLLNYAVVTLWDAGISRATYFRGMKELLEKGFLFRSISADEYFVNIKFMFNGSRVNLIKTYRLKTEAKRIE
jgi:hypothetical protein